MHVLETALPHLCAVVALVRERGEHVVPMRTQTADAGEQADAWTAADVARRECLARCREAEQSDAAQEPRVPRLRWLVANRCDGRAFVAAVVGHARGLARKQARHRGLD